MKITASTIEVNNIRLHCHHGVFSEEKALGAEFTVDIKLQFDAQGAMKYDDLSLSIDYAKIVDIVSDTMAEPCDLIEHAAWRVVENLIAAFPVIEGGTVSVTKVHPPISTPTSGATFTVSFSNKSNF